jgi:hypothetical protein
VGEGGEWTMHLGIAEFLSFEVTCSGELRVSCTLESLRRRGSLILILPEAFCMMT